MTKSEGKGEAIGEAIHLKGLLARDEDFLRAAIEALVQAALEAQTALRYTGAPRRLRPTSPMPAKLLNLTHTTGLPARSN